MILLRASSRSPVGQLDGSHLNPLVWYPSAVNWLGVVNLIGAPQQVQAKPMITPQDKAEPRQRGAIVLSTGFAMILVGIRRPIRP